MAVEEHESEIQALLAWDAVGADEMGLEQDYKGEPQLGVVQSAVVAQHQVAKVADYPGSVEKLQHVLALGKKQLVAVQTVVVVWIQMARVAYCPGVVKQLQVELLVEQAAVVAGLIAAGELPQVEHEGHHQGSGFD